MILNERRSSCVERQIDRDHRRGLRLRRGGRGMASEGAGVLVADINGSAAEPVAREIGKAAVPFAVDVTDGPRHRAMIEAAIAQFGDLDCVINNAGFTHRNQPLLDVDEATFDRVYAVNVKSIFHSMHSRGAAFSQARRGRHHQYRLDRGHPPSPGPDLVQRLESRGNLLTKSLAVARLCEIVIDKVPGSTRKRADLSELFRQPTARVTFAALVSPPCP